MDKTDQELTDLATTFLLLDDQNPHTARYLCATVFARRGANMTPVPVCANCCPTQPMFGSHDSARHGNVATNRDSALHLTAHFGLSRQWRILYQQILLKWTGQYGTKHH